MMAVPSAIAVILPSASTVATNSLLEVYFNLPATAGSKVAHTLVSLSISKEIDSDVTLISVGILETVSLSFTVRLHLL